MKKWLVEGATCINTYCIIYVDLIGALLYQLYIIRYLSLSIYPSQLCYSMLCDYICGYIIFLRLYNEIMTDYICIPSTSTFSNGLLSVKNLEAFISKRYFVY